MTMQDMIREHQRVSAEIAAEPHPWLSYKLPDLAGLEARMNERAKELLATQINTRPGHFHTNTEIVAFLLFRELNRAGGDIE